MYPSSRRRTSKCHEALRFPATSEESRLVIRARTKVVLVKVGFLKNRSFPEPYIIYIHIPFISLHNYRSAYERNRLFRKPPSLGPPLSCVKSFTFVLRQIIDSGPLHLENPRCRTCCVCAVLLIWLTAPICLLIVVRIRLFLSHVFPPFCPFRSEVYDEPVWPKSFLLGCL